MLTARDIARYAKVLADIARDHDDKLQAVAEHAASLKWAYGWTIEEMLATSLAALEILSKQSAERL